MRHYISTSVLCRRLGGTEDEQKMADLPGERIAPSPPCAHCNAIKRSMQRLQSWLGYPLETESASSIPHWWRLGTQIRSIRSVLFVLMWKYGHTLEDETLRNLLAEAECFINSHPLTVPSSDPKDLDPLTPNHILTMKSRAWMSPPGKAPKRLMRTSKKMETQDFPNVFCSRWRKDRYLKCMANTTALGFGQV